MTRQANTKRLVRRVEVALYEAEILAVLTGKISQTQIDEWWRTLCLQHFHDIITGNSMTEVNVEARRALEQLNAEVESKAGDCIATLAGTGPTKKNYLAVEGKNVVLSVFKPAENGQVPFDYTRHTTEGDLSVFGDPCRKHSTQP